MKIIKYNLIIKVFFLSNLFQTKFFFPPLLSKQQCGPVPCFQDGTSCGMHCLKPLPCGKHKCKLTCHAGECLKDSKKCTQACTVIRPLCGHPCGNQCHEGPCPDMPCKAQVFLIQILNINLIQSFSFSLLYKF